MPFCAQGHNRGRRTRFLMGHHKGQDARDSDPQKKAMDIVVRNCRPPEAVSGAAGECRDRGRGSNDDYCAR